MHQKKPALTTCITFNIYLFLSIIACEQVPCPCSVPDSTTQKDDNEKLQDIKPDASLETPSSTNKKEDFMNYRKLEPDASEIRKAICKVQPVKDELIICQKEETNSPPASSVSSKNEACAYQKSREPKQAQKKTWVPIKIRMFDIV